jgi:hypothetical protein
MVGLRIQSRERSDRVALNIFIRADHAAATLQLLMGFRIPDQHGCVYSAPPGRYAPGSEFVDPRH